MWPRAHRHFVSPRRRWTFVTFAASSASTRCSKAPCGRRANGFASPRSSSAPRTDVISGRRATMRSIADVFAVQDEIAHCVVDRLEDIPRRIPPAAVDSPSHAQRARVPIVFERTFLLDAALSRRLDRGARTFQESHRRGRRLRAGRTRGWRTPIRSSASMRCSDHVRFLRRRRLPRSVRWRSTPTCPRRTRRWRS